MRQQHKPKTTTRSPDFSFAWADDDSIHTFTKSWSGRNVEHDQIIDKATGDIFCSCEDAGCRHKQAHIYTVSGAGCKHIKALLPLIRQTFLTS